MWPRKGLIGIMAPALISSRTALRGPSRNHVHTHKSGTWGQQAGMTSDWSAEASFISARSWQSLPGPQWLREEAGTGRHCRRLHMEEWVGRRAHSHLSSPHPCPGQAAPILPGASEGIIRVPSSQPGPAATESGRLLMLGGGREMEQLNPTGPQRGPKPSPLTLPPLGAEEAI